MTNPIDPAALDAIFREARTLRRWKDRPVDEALLREAWDLSRLVPTSANCSPARIFFAVSPEAKERLKPCLSEGNVEQAMSAPATAIIAHDMEFYERLPELAPHTDARSWFAGKPDVIATTAFRNGSLQGAYFMIAARALGLDCGPMSGFDNAKVDAEFFAGTEVRSNFLCNLGYGDRSKLHPRAPRLAFDDACRVL